MTNCVHWRRKSVFLVNISIPFFATDSLTTISNISSKLSSNYVANASEILENLEEMFPLYYMIIYVKRLHIQPHNSLRTFFFFVFLESSFSCLIIYIYLFKLPTRTLWPSVWDTGNIYWRNKKLGYKVTIYHNIYTHKTFLQDFFLKKCALNGVLTICRCV